MTPGEIHGLHKQVVDDLKAQLAAAREDARNERTRAEAAEQELREQHAAYIAPMSDKLAAIRAHLKGVDMKHETMLFDCMERVSHATTRLLLAAAREALEP